MRRHDSLVDLEIGRATAQALDVDTPLGGVEVESLEGTLLAEELDLVDVLITSVVPSTRIALRVLVGHGRAQGIEDGARGNILRGNEDDGFALTLNLLFLQAIYCQRQLLPKKRKKRHRETGKGWRLTMISATSGSDSSRDFSSI